MSFGGGLRFEAFEKDVDTVTRQMVEGKEQLELLKIMSLSFPPEDSSYFDPSPPGASSPGPLATPPGGHSFLSARNPPSDGDSLLHTRHPPPPPRWM